MQHELLMVLAGYPTSLNTAVLLHPGEQDLFEQAIEFGGRLRSVKLACRDAAGPLARVVENSVLSPFLASLVKIEKQILSGSSAYGAFPAVSLAAIFADSVYKWDRALEYAQSLMEFQGPLSEMVTQIQVDMLSGYPEIAKFAKSSLVELDKAWLRSVSPWVLWGQPVDWPELKAHPGLDKDTAKCIYDLGYCLSKVEMLEFCKVPANRDILMANSLTFESIEVPISLEDIRSKANAMKLRLFAAVVGQNLFEDKMVPTIQVLRNVVLVGSASFARAFLDTANTAAKFPLEPNNKLLQKAIASYFEDYDELDPRCSPLCEAMVTLDVLPGAEQHSSEGEFDDLLFAVRAAFKLRVEWPLTLYFTGQQCRVYGDVCGYLLTISMVLAQVETGKRSPESFKYGLFLRALWQHFQWSLDALVADVKGYCAGLPGQHVDEHNKSLKTLGRQLLFDDFETRCAMRQLLLSAIAVSEGRSTVDSIAGLIDVLAPRSDLNDLMLLLEPFD